VGSVGNSSNSYEDFSSIPYTPFHHGNMTWEEKQAQDKRYVKTVADKFRKFSNLDEWYDGLTYAQGQAIDGYVGNDYATINKAQYNIPWEKMSDHQREMVSNLHNALNSFELTKPIEVYRETNFKIFGSTVPMSMSEIRNHLTADGEFKQIDGFMSFSTHSGGSAVDGRGLVIEMKVPPSTGAGAYIGNTYGLKPESEYLTNNNSVLRFDKDSMFTDGKGRVHIKAEWVGRSEAQTISPTYQGLKVKSKSGNK